MHPSLITAACVLALPVAAWAHHESPPADDTAPTKELGVISVTASRPTSLPTHIPTTTHGITREEIARTVNATDSEDVLKYFPSLLVRKRYIGDYNHAIVSSRASGTANSARSAVYADGILLSNFLGNGVGGLSFAPRWGMVSPAEIERADVMYGPFSATYPGNSVGAVVDYVTRMPKRFEVHAQAGYTAQPFKLYGTDTTYKAWQTSMSVGNRSGNGSGDWSWWLSASHTDSSGQPQTFANRLVSDGVVGSAGTPVTGARLDANHLNQPWYLIGAGTQYDTVQDHIKVKLAYDISSTLRASYLLGLWQNTADGNPASYLRDANGNTVTSGTVNIDGRSFALKGSDFNVTRERLLHVMHGFSLKQHTQGEWDWEVAASAYDYQRDDKRQNDANNAFPASLTGGAGTLADGRGTGWHNLALKGTWRPDRARSAHVVDFGYQLDAYQLRHLTTKLSRDYLHDSAGPLHSKVGGRTQMQSLYAQDTWKIAPRWKSVLGLRAEHWQATDGKTNFSASSQQQHPSRSGTWYSPKGALSWQWLEGTVLKASVGRAVRMPTVQELYGATSTSNSQYINDPNLRPERSLTTELTAEKDLGQALARLTWFTERTRDALYSQSVFDSSANKNITRVQNVDRIATSGAEAALTSEDLFFKGFDLQASLTYTDSKITRNRGFLTTPGDTDGRWQPNIARWRATLQGSYRFDDQWSASLGLRHSGKQYRLLNNTDVNGQTYTGVSPFTVVDLRVRHRFDKQWSASFGIDNLTNKQYWNFHPYPQRSYTVQVAFDL